MIALAFATLLAAAPSHCGTERWPVKTLTDSGASAVDLANLTFTTVEDLRALAAPTYNDANPRAEPEKTIYMVAAHLVGYKMEADQDFHVVIAGDSGATMIVEFPNPPCAAGSRVIAKITAARAAFVKRFGKPTAKFKRLSPQPPITITGVGFFDKIHGQTGVAPNGVEIHPVIEVQ